MNYETLKMYENDALRCGEAGSNAIHLAAGKIEQPTIGYGYDLRQNGFSASDLNSKVGRTVITQEQMDQIKNYSNSKPAEGTPDYKAYLSLMASITITEAEATQLLQIKVSEYEQALNSILSKHNVSLNDSQKSALISLFYSSCGATVGSIEAEHPTLTKKLLPLMASTNSTVKFYAQMGIWYEIAYRSNGDKIHLNRRFAEANEFLGHPESKPLTPSTAKTVLYVSSVNEANMAISFMNANKDTMYNAIKNATDYPSSEKDIYKYIQKSFSDAISTFLSNQNYTQSYDIDTLFTEWNLYTDLQINTSTGTTSYGDVTGSDKRDLIFINGEQDGTTVHADAGNDFVGGSSKRDIVHSGSGDDVIYTYGGNDEVYTTDGKKEDYKQIYLGAGSDTFTGGVGIDIVDGGVSEDVETDTNTIHLGGGNDQYYGGIGKDKVDGGSGDNTIRTDAGNDEVKMSGSTSSDLNWVYLGKGSDSFDGGAGRDVVNGGQEEDVAEDKNTINLNGGSDEYKGGAGTDIVHGGNDSDVIYGGDGGVFRQCPDGANAQCAFVG